MTTKGLPKRLETAFKHFSEKDLENMLLQLCPALEATAKKAFPEINSPGRRVKKWLEKNTALIFYVGCGLTHPITFVTDNPDAHLTINWGGKGSLAEVFYKLVRCHLTHEAEIPEEDIEMIWGYGLGCENNKVIVSSAMIVGLMLCIVGDPVNESHKNSIPSGPELLFPDIRDTEKNIAININQHWGELLSIKEKIYFNCNQIA